MPEKRQIVLVVDDTPENIEVLRQLLRADYTIHAAISGEKGLEIARKLPQPDIILLDLFLQMGGHGSPVRGFDIDTDINSATSSPR